MNARAPLRLLALAPAFACIALIGFACGRVEIDPLAGGDGQGGAPSLGGQTGAGSGGSSSAGGNNGAGGTLGAGGTPGTGGASGGGGAIGVGGATGGSPCNQIGVEMTCIARSCRPDYCPTCGGNRFLRCANPGDSMPVCGPAPPCPPPICTLITTLNQCAALPSCHSVFQPIQPPNTCADPASCVVFTGCANGLLTVCAPRNELRCGVAPPQCPPGFAASLNGACYEGCVARSACAPIP